MSSRHLNAAGECLHIKRLRKLSIDSIPNPPKTRRVVKILSTRPQGTITADLLP